MRSLAKLCMVISLPMKTAVTSGTDMRLSHQCGEYTATNCTTASNKGGRNCTGAASELYRDGWALQSILYTALLGWACCTTRTNRHSIAEGHFVGCGKQQENRAGATSTVVRAPRGHLFLL